MAPDDFLMATLATGSDPDNWDVVLTEMNAVGDMNTGRVLEWDHQDYAVYQTLADGSTKGRGTPVVIWRFKGLRVAQRDYLREFCTGPSAAVYIRTPTNETATGARTWADYQCIAHWVERGEIIADGLDRVDEVEMRFTHCIAVGT